MYVFMANRLLAIIFSYFLLMAMYNWAALNPIIKRGQPGGIQELYTEAKTNIFVEEKISISTIIIYT